MTMARLQSGYRNHIKKYGTKSVGRKKGNKGCISDLSTLIMYKRDLELLRRDGVKESIQKIVEFHKNNGSGEYVIRMGERLLLEYDKPKWSDEVELQFLKKDLENDKNWKKKVQINFC